MEGHHVIYGLTDQDLCYRHCDWVILNTDALTRSIVYYTLFHDSNPVHSTLFHDSTQFIPHSSMTRPSSFHTLPWLDPVHSTLFHDSTQFIPHSSMTRPSSFHTLPWVDPVHSTLFHDSTQFIPHSSMTRPSSFHTLPWFDPVHSTLFHDSPQFIPHSSVSRPSLFHIRLIEPFTCRISFPSTPQDAAERKVASGENSNHTTEFTIITSYLVQLFWLRIRILRIIIAFHGYYGRSVGQVSIG